MVLVFVAFVIPGMAILSLFWQKVSGDRSGGFFDASRGVGSLLWQLR